MPGSPHGNDPLRTTDHAPALEPEAPLETLTTDARLAPEIGKASPSLAGKATVTFQPKPGESRDGSSATPSAPQPSIPGYEIEAVLGRGGMGVVYKARHLALKRTVALKMVLAGGHAAEAERRRFLAEAEAVAAVQHPGIVQVHDLGTHEGLPFFALELCTGGSLADRLEDGPLPPREAAPLVEVVSRAVQAAHERGIVHRDLKPANVLLDAAGAPKVTDFGLAKRVEGDSGLTRTGAVMGTPSYMAPEQAEGKKAVGPPADVYALGAILYEMLTGRPPFRAATALDTILQVIADDPVSPRRLNAQVPRDLETVALKCLEKSPGRRYASAALLAEDLRRWQAGEPIAARPAGRLERAVKWARRRPAAAAAVALGAALVVMWGWFTVMVARQRSQLAAAELRALDLLGKETAARGEADALAKKEADARAAAEKEEKAARFQALRAEHARHSLQIDLTLRAWQENDVALAEEMLEDVAPAFREAWETRLVRVLCRRKARAVRATKGDPCGVALSSDGERVLVAGQDGALQVQTARGELERALLGQAGAPRAVALSGDGKVAAAAGEDKTVRVWLATGGKPAIELKGHGDAVARLALSADGKRAASGDVAGKVIVWDTATGKRKCGLDTGTRSVDTLAISADGERVAANGPEGEVRVWEVETGRLKFTLKKGHGLGARAVALSADGKRMASCDHGETLRVWDVGTGREARSIRVPGGAGALAMTADGKQIACGEVQHDVSSNEGVGNISVWDADTGRPRLRLRGHNSEVYHLAISADGRRIASWDGEGPARLWDTGAAEAVVVKKEEDGPIRWVAVSRDGGRFYWGDNGEQVRVGDARTGRSLKSLEGEGGTVCSVEVTADGSRVVAGCGDAVRMWDAATGRLTLTLRDPDHEKAVTCAAASGGGKRIFWVSRDRADRSRAHVSDGGTGRELVTLTGNAGLLLCVAVSSDGKRIVAGEIDGTVRTWDGTLGKPEHVLKGHAGAVSCVAISADGRLVVSGGADRVIRVWGASGGRPLLELKGHTDNVTRVVFSADGKRLFSGGGDGTVRVWELETGQQKLTLKAHRGMVSGLALSKGGRLVTGNVDGVIKVWDVASGR
jgi:WD40 repeat protein